MKQNAPSPLAALRNVAHQVISLDPKADDFEIRWKNLQGTAHSALRNATYGVSGNPRIENARELAAAARRKQAEQLRARIQPIIDELRKPGCQTYRDLANGLNNRNIKPPRADKWTAATVHSIEHPRQ